MRLKWPALKRAFRHLRLIVNKIDTLGEDIEDLRMMIQEQRKAIVRLETAIDQQGRTIEAATQTNKELVQHMEDINTALDDLTNQVEASTSAEQGAAVLIGKLAELIQANATDPAKVRALAARLKATADPLAAAIVANTPSENPAGPPV